MKTIKRQGSDGWRGCVAITICTLVNLSVAFGQDVSMYLAVKGENFVQSGVGLPTPQTEEPPFVFFANVEPTLSNSVNSATVRTPPGNVTRTLTRGEFDDQFEFNTNFTTRAELDAAFANGTYTFTINTANQGIKTPALILPARSNATDPSAAPHISNWTAAQMINTGLAFTVTWDAFGNGTAADFVQLSIDGDMGEITNSPSPGETGALTGTSTSFVIPANTLAPGQTYRARLLHAKISPNTLEYPGATGITGYFKETEFVINTVNPFGRLQFSMASYIINETGTVATITVNRIGGSQGTVTLNFQADGGDASSGSDYTPTNGTLRFDPSVTNQTFTVTIINDDEPEAPETVNLFLFNPTGGATLGALDFASLTILDDESPPGPNAEFYLVGKGQAFTQSGAGAPILTAGTPFAFFADVEERFPGSINSITLRLPNTTTRMLTRDPDDNQFEFEQEFATKSALDAAFGVGNYTFTIAGLTDGTNTPTLTLPAETAPNTYPNNPRLSNWSDAQAIDANAPFTLVWDAFTGGTSNDFVQVFIENNSGEEIFSSGEFRDPDALNGTNVGVMIPAGLLETNQTYQASLLFARLVDFDTNSYPGVPGVAVYFKETKFSIMTAPPQGRLQFSAAAYNVNEGNGMVFITVNRTGGSTGQVGVNFATVPGSATGADYSDAPGLLTFPNGQTSQTFFLSIVDDAVAEGTEIAQLVLSNPTGGAVLGSQSNAVLSIADNEVAGAGTFQFSATNYNILETGPAAKVIITRTGGSGGPVTIDLIATDGTATAPADYTALASNLTFGVGVASRTIDLRVVNDTLDETNETVRLFLLNPSGGASLGVRSNATVTITDNDVAGKFSFSAATYSVSETAQVARVVVSRTGGAASEATVELGVAGGTATAEFDYSFTSGVLSFAANELKKTNVIDILNDPFAEGNETVNLTLRNPGGGAMLGSISNAVLTILDDEVALQFSKPIYTKSEAGPSATITVSRSGPANKAVSVNFATVGGGTATPGTNLPMGADYLATNGTLHFPAGALSKTFAVRIFNDTLVEPNETVNLALSNPTNALLGSITNATLLITNNDFGGVISFSATNYTVTEVGPVATIMVARTGGTASGVTVDFTTGDDTATAGADYTMVFSNLTFAAGELRKTIKIPVHNDQRDEENEKFRVQLSNPTGGASLGVRSSATVTITDNDIAGIVQFKAATYSVTENGTNAVITITRAGGTASNVMVNFSTSDDTANAGSDYNAVASNVNFGPGELSKTVLIPINQDPFAEGNETVLLRLRDATGGGKLGAISNAVLTILDDEAVFLFTNSVYEVSEAGPVATVQVIRSGFAGTTATIEFMTGDGGALAGTDYVGTNGTLTFGPGVTNRPIIVRILNDQIDENSEDFEIILSNPTGGPQIDPSADNAIVRIIDNDSGGTIQFSAAAYNVNEGTPNASIKVVRTGTALASNVTVHLETSNGTASAGSDYTAVSSNLTFAAGETMKTILVSIQTDSTNESSETVNLTLSIPTGGAVIGPTNPATLTINNAPDPNAVPLAGAELFMTTATPSMNTTFNRSFSASTFISGTNNAPNFYSIQGFTASATTGIIEGFVFGIADLTGPGTFTFTNSGPHVALYSRTAPTGSFAYVTGDPGDSGTIIIDGFDETRVSGRFDMIMSDDTDETKKIRVVGKFRAIIQ